MKIPFTEIFHSVYNTFNICQNVLYFKLSRKGYQLRIGDKESL